MKLSISGGALHSDHIIFITYVGSAWRRNAKVNGQCPPRRCAYAADPQHGQDEPQPE
jgi:hypothetical protein